LGECAQRSDGYDHLLVLENDSGLRIAADLAEKRPAERTET